MINPLEDDRLDENLPDDDLLAEIFDGEHFTMNVGIMDEPI